ncbi:unnamed protein product, partial [Phaeothamnion confervicola]
QSNPNSHLSSVKTFEELRLPPALLRGVQDLQFVRPSAIQEHALPAMLKEPPENLIAQAQSGSGKTAAFCLGLLFRMDTTLPVTQAIVIAPTRELAVQCADETLRPMARHFQPPLTVAMALSGGSAARSGGGRSGHVVVGTPGTIENWMKKRLLDLRNIRVFVLDEADEMISQDGHRESTTRILRAVGHHPQILLFSATFPPEVHQFALKLVRSPLTSIRLASDTELVLEEIMQLWVDLRGRAEDGRVDFLADLYEMLEMGQSIVFCATKRESDRVCHTLQSRGFTCSNLHGGLEPRDRDGCMADFRSGQNKVLITTNVLSRGVDVPAVSLVVNYDVPVKAAGGGGGYSGHSGYGGGRGGPSSDPDYETYLHRIGRTGRFGRQGVAINLVADDNALAVIKAMEAHFSPTKPMICQVQDDVEESER